MKVAVSSWDLDADAAVFEKLAEKALDEDDSFGWKLYTEMSKALAKLANQYDILKAEGVIEEG
jgi:hypothetical protein